MQECDLDRRVCQAQRETGSTPKAATLEACELRLRPIMMTSLAFILGVVPLVLSEGAGAEMRKTLGTAVFSGMLGVTLFGIFLTPVFYFVIQWVSDIRAARRKVDEVEEDSHSDENGDGEQSSSELAAVGAAVHGHTTGNGAVHGTHHGAAVH